MKNIMTRCNHPTLKEVLSAVRKIFSVLVAVGAVLSVWVPMPASAASMTLQRAHNITGNQAEVGVGVSFLVNKPITVCALGIYDSKQDGIMAPSTAPLSAYLFITGVVPTSLDSHNPTKT